MAARASATALPDALLANLATLLALDGPDVLRYDDPKLGQSRRIRAVRGAIGTRVGAFLLVGDTRAAGWIGELLVERLPADAFGRALLAGMASPPTAVPARGAQVCSCFDVTEPQIDAALAQCSGGAEAQLVQLQQRLRCGTNCGSCLPRLRTLVRRPLVAA